jgi:hypothetical protein
VNLLYRRNVNQPQPSTAPFNNNRRPFPQYRDVTMISNGAGSRFHSLQLEAERKFSRGLYFQAGWSWAKQLAHGAGQPGDEGPVIQNAYDRQADWGDASLYRHRFVSSQIWELPFGQGRKWLSHWRGVPGHIVGGWQLAGITILNTGLQLTPTYTGRDVSNTNNVGGRPDRIADGNLPKDQRTIQRWFDAAAFVVPPANAGRFGNTGIGVLTGPGTVTVNLSATKTWRFGEQGRFEFCVSTTNALNHPNFGNPNVNISAPNSVGRITALQGRDAGPRNLMAGTRLEF